MVYTTHYTIPEHTLPSATFPFFPIIRQFHPSPTSRLFIFSPFAPPYHYLFCFISLRFLFIKINSILCNAFQFQCTFMNRISTKIVHPFYTLVKICPPSNTFFSTEIQTKIKLMTIKLGSTRQARALNYI